VEDFGPRAPAADWAGDYLNGDRHFQLDEEDGQLINPLDPGRAFFRGHHYRDDVYFTDMERPGGPLTGFAFRLVRDEAGRRYVILGDRAYVRLEDRAGPTGDHRQTLTSRARQPDGGLQGSQR
jgi:hypothetical protein